MTICASKTICIPTKMPRGVRLSKAVPFDSSVCVTIRVGTVTCGGELRLEVVIGVRLLERVERGERARLLRRLEIREHRGAQRVADLVADLRRRVVRDVRLDGVDGPGGDGHAKLGARQELVGDL